MTAPSLEAVKNSLLEILIAETAAGDASWGWSDHSSGAIYTQIHRTTRALSCTLFRAENSNTGHRLLLVNGCIFTLQPEDMKRLHAAMLAPVARAVDADFAEVEVKPETPSRWFCAVKPNEGYRWQYPLWPKTFVPCDEHGYVRADQLIEILGLVPLEPGNRGVIADREPVDVPFWPLALQLDEEKFLKDVPPAPVTPKRYWLLITGGGKRWSIALPAEFWVPEEVTPGTLGQVFANYGSGNLPEDYKLALSDQQPLGTEPWPMRDAADAPIGERREGVNNRRWLLIVGPDGKRWAQPLPLGTEMPEKVTRGTLEALLDGLDGPHLPADHKIAFCLDCPLAAQPWSIRSMTAQSAKEGPLL